MRRTELQVAAFIGLIALGACSAPNGVNACTDQQNAGIVATLEDSLTGSRGPFNDVTAVASEGAFADSAEVPSLGGPAQNPASIILVPERAGVYQVDVSADGYEPWTTTGIAVLLGECNHVITRSVLVRMIPEI